ncbi:MAG: hypothetical protein ACJAQZ_003792 [Planctomycetota bacterium]
MPTLCTEDSRKAVREDAATQERLDFAAAEAWHVAITSFQLR